MSIQERRERERGARSAERENLIIAAARELAETEGGDAVTTRRLAGRVEYSQPVLYRRFAGPPDPRGRGSARYRPGGSAGWGQ